MAEPVPSYHVRDSLMEIAIKSVLDITHYSLVNCCEWHSQSALLQAVLILTLPSVASL